MYNNQTGLLITSKTSIQRRGCDRLTYSELEQEVEQFQAELDGVTGLQREQWTRTISAMKTDYIKLGPYFQKKLEH